MPGSAGRFVVVEGGRQFAAQLLTHVRHARDGGGKEFSSEPYDFDSPVAVSRTGSGGGAGCRPDELRVN
ncbi:hypothetical protein [Micromonospora echinospora]|uniref:hypothetical protein n=1 Tax=Micromonospora echinospora TaxID=1877 RepID=UPI0012FDE70F|nr:hypothetical protein [Micromonospora echinospora]